MTVGALGFFPAMDVVRQALPMVLMMLKMALVICILGLIAAGAMMAVGRSRGEGGEHVGKLGWVLGGVIVISAAVSLVGFISGA